jgi:hypothetical protein
MCNRAAQRPTGYHFFFEIRRISRKIIGLPTTKPKKTKKPKPQKARKQTKKKEKKRKGTKKKKK